MRKLLLIILDGWGHREEEKGNAIKLANTKNFDSLWKKYPHALLESSGESVGLPEGQMGTSEVNHMTIGAGRVIFQDLVKINKALEGNGLAKNSVIQKVIEHTKKNNSTLHLKGLVSTGGVHSHQDHLYGLLSFLKKEGVKKVIIHAFTDGRDTPPKSAKKFIKDLEEYLNKINYGKIGSVTGRYYAMDRDENWKRIDKSFFCLTKRKGRKFKSASQAIDYAYAKNETDEFIEPSLIEMEDGEFGCVESGDGVIFFNFRTDRMVQLTKKFLESEIENLHLATMTQYREGFNVGVIFPPEKIEKTLGEIISKAGLKQLRVTETEKFNHLTYFFNCKKLKPFEGEDRIMLDSYSDIKTHDERPKMRTEDIASEISEAISKKSHALIITNICNADMIGHTAKMKKVIKGIETADKAVGKLYKKCLKNGYDMIVTADHGNAEETVNPITNEPITSHTVNPVPFILVSKKYKKIKRDHGNLTDIAPTILKILNLPKPRSMTGKSFI